MREKTLITLNMINYAKIYQQKQIAWWWAMVGRGGWWHNSV